MLSKLGPALGENGLVTFGRAQGRLKTGRPEFAGIEIAQINKGSPIIACRILAPAGDGQIMPAAVPAASAADDNMISPIGQEMHFRSLRTGTGHNPQIAFAIPGPFA